MMNICFSFENFATTRAEKASWMVGNWILYHDFALLSLLLFNNVLVNAILKSFYSPDFAPCDFWLIPMLKEKPRGRKFNLSFWSYFSNTGFFEVDSSKRYSTCIEKWVKRWDRSLSSKDSYFKKEWFIFCCKLISWLFTIFLLVFMEHPLHVIKQQA